MKDEEMAEAQIKEWDNLLYPQMYSVALVKDFIRKAFLAGLKAGRPKFHKVIDGYMPPRDKFYDTINVLTDKGDIAYYSYNFDCWVAKPSSMEIEPPIAWCEIPKFKEE